ncbi:hypothetical protein V1525DRAFT_275587 [Lipomyces kononenkoae]|uniref:Uncharacterized protein n=1 Tax=Lipomyces kononenkoae TaxID=34357 RepID=A0ACC3SUE6_LIPKO
MSNQTSVHVGDYPAIPEDASPGLLFLKEFLPAIDSLDERPAIAKFLSPDVRFIGGGTIITRDALYTMFRGRSGRLSSFGHRVKKAWDIAAPFVGPDGSVREGRTVLYESVSSTIFKDDPEQVPAEVPEFSVIELEPCASDPGIFVAVEIRFFMDPKPVLDRREQLRSNSTN